MIVARDCDPLRRFAWSRFKNWGLFTISAGRARPSAEIRVVEVQKLRTVYDFCWPRATLCGDSRGRGSETEDILRFLACPRDPLRRFAWSRGLFTISAGRARPSAEIRVVEVQKLRTFYDFCWPRATLCGDSRGRGSKTEDFLRFLRCARDPLRRSCASKRSCCGAVRVCLSLGEPSAEIVRVEVLSLWRRAIFLLAKRPLEVVSWFALLLSQSRGRGFDSPLVRGSSGLKIAAFKYKRSTRSVLLQLRLENRNF